MRLAFILSGIVVLFVTNTPARADELRPAYVELTQQSAKQWTLLWKASAQSRLGATGEAIVPENCEVRGAPQKRFANTNILTTLTLSCNGNLEGQNIGLKALELSSTDALVRVAPLGGETQTLRLTPDQPIATIAGKDEIANVAWTYTVIGVEHIVLGFDHLLFVLALVLLLKGGWLVAKTVTAFTVAHSITLIGTTLGYLSLPQQPVEAVIALSIVFLAVEIVKAKPGEFRLSERFPWVVAFLFGLLHGFGFAGALAEIGLPQGDVPMALLTFNLGVEIGQLLIVAAGLLVLWLIRKYQDSLTQPVKTASAYGIGIIATYWFIERMIA
ncbi:HupE/UreJ family protein [Parasphingorhabdus halotolerans]|uniref:HupE/UreJ family protein n=1 Tax=Parasphingorhabdus halotolerans TaxID=2725558 RepID=A0A6H2DN10_9SPHN|nr:HupE/UreJ family protein [Parasphingorhabdus halotolerans]QJB69770.1 HupE/UreJ family protein [Parasphingorhabdus halotolerans]